jgi:hypothetical protein
VVWVQQAFGDLVGGHNAWWTFCACISDSAIYPLLAAEYVASAVGIGEHDPRHYILVLALAEFTVIGVTLMKLCGNSVVVKFVALSSVVSLVPVMLYVVTAAVAVPQQPERWIRFTAPADGSGSGSASIESPQTQWKLLISWVIWLNSGYLSLGALAAGVENPGRTFPLIVATLVPFVALVYILPLLMSLSLSESIALYTPGYFAILAREYVGSWLAHLFLGGAIGCTVALYASTIVISEVTLQYFVEERFHAARISDDIFFARRRADNAPRCSCSGGRFRHWLLQHEAGGAARVWIISCGAISAALQLLPYKLLIELTITVVAPPSRSDPGTLIQGLATNRLAKEIAMTAQCEWAALGSDSGCERRAQVVAYPTLLCLAAFIVLRVRQPKLSAPFLAISDP